MTRSRFVLCLLALGLLLAACGPQAQAESSQDQLQAWIDAPLDGSNISQEHPYTIIFSGASFGDPIGNFELLVNGAPESTLPAVYQNSQGGAQYSYGEYDWMPPAPGTYLIQVRALSGDQTGPFAQAQVVVGLISAPGELEANEGGHSVTAIPSQTVNCRYGNSSQWDIADTLFEAETYVPQARGQDNLWVLFNGPVTQVPCWVFVDNLDMQIDGNSVAIADIPESLLPFAPYPATPTPSPTPTFTPEPQPQATAVPECSDGIDNDGDGRIDYGSAASIAGGTADRECTSPNDNNEAR